MKICGLELCFCYPLLIIKLGELIKILPFFINNFPSPFPGQAIIVFAESTFIEHNPFGLLAVSI